MLVFPKPLRRLLPLLAGGALLAACQADPPTTQNEAVNREAVVKTDSSATLVTRTDSLP